VNTAPVRMGRRPHLRLSLLTTLSATLLGALSANPALALAAPRSSGQATETKASTLAPNPGYINYLSGTSATSAADVWSVGYYQSFGVGPSKRALIEHWNGKSWRVYPAPNPSPLYNFLNGVSATSRTNAWAVGDFDNVKAASADYTLTMRWNGSKWARVASPSPSSVSSDLYGVSATSTSNAWAVGSYRNNKASEIETLVLHWNGKSWKQYSAPNPSPGHQDENVLKGVSATSASNAWAVGGYSTSTNTSLPLILHWNGRSWQVSKVVIPNLLSVDLYGVSATSASNAWAVGDYTTNNSPANKTLILHWNGQKWSRFNGVNPTDASLLMGVSATSATNAWAVGLYCKNTSCSVAGTIVLHWKGRAWKRVIVHDPSPAGSNVLSGVSATSNKDAWAAGDYTLPGMVKTLVLRWTGTRWSRA
jgi:hypothetical protein